MKHLFYHKLQDFLVVLRGIWFLLLFDLVALAAFLILPQGTDVLLVITENTGNLANLWQVAGLVGALIFWCISAEYGTRVLIYLTDNSGRSLHPERVKNRERYQEYISFIALFYPIVLMLVAFTGIYIDNHRALTQAHRVYDLGDITTGTIIIIALILLAGILLWWLYPGRLLARISERYPNLRWIAISKHEKYWASKLYGMLNDIRVDIPVDDEQYHDNDLPREVYLPNGIKLPKSRYIVPYQDNPQVYDGRVRVWMFSIKIGYYRCLLRQLCLLLVIAAVLIIGIGLVFPVSWDMRLGAAAIICFAFGCWQVVYVALHFMDKAQPVPIRFLLLVWVLICSYINNDHPVRSLDRKPAQRQTLNAHFNDWMKHVSLDQKRDTFYRVSKSDSIPVIFVSAEGGALRTGAITGMLLARLQEKYPMFEHYLYAYSSVSGGTLGSNFFNAQVIQHRINGRYRKYQWLQESRNFFETDFLSPATAKLVFGEIINYAVPWHLKCADRAIALEKSFEEGWRRSYNKGNNLLGHSFNITEEFGLPAVFINTTEVESGLQNVWSNVDLKALPLAPRRDLYGSEQLDLQYSSAIDLSDRFPLVSPGACFIKRDAKGNEVERRHFIDGGYYENKGSETLLQVLKALKLKHLKVKPYILQFNFSESAPEKNVKFMNEITEITSGVYDTRSGRGSVAEDELRNYVDTLKGTFIPISVSLNTKQLPMSWVLSHTVVRNLDNTLQKLVAMHAKDSLVTEVLTQKDAVELHKLFFYADSNKRYSKQPAANPKSNKP